METLIVLKMFHILLSIGEVVSDRRLGLYFEVAELCQELWLQGPHVLVDLLLLPLLAGGGNLPVQDPEEQPLLGGEQDGDVIVAELELLLLVPSVVLQVLPVKQSRYRSGSDAAGSSPATAEDQVSGLLSDVLVENEDHHGHQGAVDVAEPDKHCLGVVGRFLDLWHLP